MISSLVKKKTADNIDRMRSIWRRTTPQFDEACDLMKRIFRETHETIIDDTLSTVYDGVVPRIYRVIIPTFNRDVLTGFSRKLSTMHESYNVTFSPNFSIAVVSIYGMPALAIMTSSKGYDGPKNDDVRDLMEMLYAYVYWPFRRDYSKIRKNLATKIKSKIFSNSSEVKKLYRAADEHFSGEVADSMEGWLCSVFQKHGNYLGGINQMSINIYKTVNPMINKLIILGNVDNFNNAGDEIFKMGKDWGYHIEYISSRTGFYLSDDISNGYYVVTNLKSKYQIIIMTYEIPTYMNLLIIRDGNNTIIDPLACLLFSLLEYIEIEDKKSKPAIAWTLPIRHYVDMLDIWEELSSKIEVVGVTDRLLI